MRERERDRERESERETGRETYRGKKGERGEVEIKSCMHGYIQYVHKKGRDKVI